MKFVTGSTGNRTAHAQPSQSKRALLMSVVNSRLMYACPTWAERACKHAICRNLMIRAQRIAALRVTRAYHTVLAEAALFLAGTHPGDLLALERKRVRSKLDDPDRAMRSGEQSGTYCLLPGRTDGVGALEEPGRARFLRTC